MSDTDASSFDVTDRRSAAQSQSQPQDETDAEFSPKSDAEAPLPDPAMILSFAAMQMDTRALVMALTAVFDGHAWRALGLVSDPRVGVTQQDLPAAQTAIDCAQFLLSKIEGDLSETERRDATRRLNDLRMNYLNKIRQ
jgi:hypothetical protein